MSFKTKAEKKAYAKGIKNGRFNRVDKYSYYSQRIDDPKLTQGQRDYAKKRVDQFQALWAKEEAEDRKQKGLPLPSYIGKTGRDLLKIK